MILEIETFKKFGYYSYALKSKSNKKKILGKCDDCGKIRETPKCAYCKLCHTCSMRSEETKLKIREAHYGNHHSEKTKEKMRDAKQNMTEETKQKISDNHADFRGEKSGMWRGGISFEPYCIKFNDEFKERVREYWNRKCVLCGKTEKENIQHLSVHHVTYNKNTCCDISIPLFIVLCSSCHNKTHFNREEWEIQFKQIIYSKNIDGKCYFTIEEMEGFLKKK